MAMRVCVEQRKMVDCEYMFDPKKEHEWSY